MATAAAPGSTRQRRRSRARRAAANGSPPSKPGWILARAATSRSRSCASPAFTGPDKTRWSRSRAARARRIVKPGQVFNRIHVGDIAQAIDAAFARRASGIFNVADDEPTPPADPIVFAAQLMGVEPPPEIPFEQAAPTMSPMALSFWQECRRVKNDKLKRELGVSLRYPTYREGLRALFDERET